MKKKIIVLFLCLTLLVAVTIESSAHSGGTDSRGGHRDHSTGDYHYHHGNPAHDHYDIDGDGAIDCPYEFSYWKAGEPPMWVYCLFALLFVCSFMLGFIIRGRQANKQIAESERKHQATEKNLNSKIKALQDYAKNTSLHRQKKEEDVVARKREELAATYPPHIKINFREPNPFSLFEDFNNDDDPFSLPPGVYIEKGAFLRLGNKSKDYPYGNYTVFTLPDSDVYHTRSCCRGRTSMPPVYIMSVLETKRPCTYCGHRLPHNQKYPQWYVNFKNTTIRLDIEW